MQDSILWILFFQANFWFIYSRMVINKLTYNSLLTTTKKTHRLLNRRQNSICFPRSLLFCDPQEYTLLHTRYAENNAHRVMPMEMHGLIQYLLRTNYNLFTYDFCLFCRNVCLNFTNRIFWRHEYSPKIITRVLCFTIRIRHGFGTVICAYAYYWNRIPETKIAEFANSVGLDEVAHNEPLYLDSHCLPSCLWILNMIKLELNSFWKFADENFVVCFLVVEELN